MRSGLFLSVFLFLIISTASGQVDVSGYFQSDSVKIGKPTVFVLKATYPKEYTILFPDSTFDFTPFEIYRKSFYPTNTIEGLSTDSAVYLLSTYQIDPVQRLRLPVYVVHARDCTMVMTRTDSVFLKELVAHIPDSVSAKDLPLKTNTANQKVRQLFNYPLTIMIVGGVLLTAILIWVLFRKQIIRYFKLRRLNRDYRTFLEQYRALNERLDQQFSRHLAEHAMFVWKEYMEKLVDQPYTKYTTKELKRVISNTELIDTLHQIDVMAYSDNSGKDLACFNRLQRHAEDAFFQKQEEIKHG